MSSHIGRVDLRVRAVYALRMRAHVLLLGAVCSVVFGCSMADDEPGPAGGAGQTSTAGTGSAGTSSASGGTSSSAGSGNSAGAANPSAGSGNSAGASSAAGAASGGSAAGGSAGSANGGSNGGGSGGSANNGGSASAGAPASSCAGLTGAKFCEDWDKLPAGKPNGAYSVSSGVVVDTSKAFSGAQSLHFQKLTKPASGTPNIDFTQQFPLASNDMHGRAMIFMAQTPQTSSHWNFITSSNSGGTEWSIGGQYGKFELVCDPPDNGLDSKTAFPGGKWVCMQWQFKYPGNDNTTFVTKIDGVSVDQGEFTGANSKGEKWKAGTWNNLKLGWEVFGSSDTDVEFWVDDLAFGEQPIACPTK
jgi:hypothetical protein